MTNKLYIVCDLGEIFSCQFDSNTLTVYTGDEFCFCVYKIVHWVDRNAFTTIPFIDVHFKWSHACTFVRVLYMMAGFEATYLITHLNTPAALSTNRMVMFNCGMCTTVICISGFASGSVKYQGSMC